MSAEETARKQEKAARLIVLIGVRAQFEAMIKAVGEQLGKELRVRLNIDRMLKVIAQIYFDEFTESDIDQLIAFWESPIGRRYIEAQPRLTAAGAAAAQAELQRQVGIPT